MTAPSPPEAPAHRRVGLAVGLRPEMEARYRELHADPWKAVLDRITDSNIREYTIYIARIEGRPVLFSHFVYVGENFEADMARMAADEETRRWWGQTDPCQIVLEGTPDGQQWLPLEELFHHA